MSRIIPLSEIQQHLINAEIANVDLDVIKRSLEGITLTFANGGSIEILPDFDHNSQVATLSVWDVTDE